MSHLQSVTEGAQRVNMIFLPDGRRKELYARDSSNGPVLIEITYPTDEVPKEFK